MWSTSKQDRCLRASLLILTCAACAGVVYISLTYTGHHLKVYSAHSKENDIEQAKLSEENCIPVCDSKECIYEANLLLRSVNPATDPCYDYQNFLCGSYVQQFGPNENGSILMDTTIQLMNKLKGIIDNIEAEPETASAKMKIYYDSCASIGSSDLRGVEHFKEFLKEIGIPNWPDLVPDFTFANNHLPKYLAALRVYLPSFINFYFAPATETESQVEEKFVTVTFSFYMLNPIPKDGATEILEYFYIEPEEIETIISDYVHVSKTIFNLKEEHNESCENNCDIRVNCSIPEDEEWKDVCEMVEHYLNIIELQDYASTDEILVKESEAKDIKNVIPRLKSLSDRSLANYFALSLLWNSLEELNFYFLQKKVKYFEHFDDPERPYMRINNKWIHCIHLLTLWMKVPLENEFFQQYLTKSISEEIIEILNSYIQDVSNLISAQEWIVSDWSMGMANYMRHLKPNLSYLKEIFPNETFVNDFYKVFHPSTTNFFWNAKELRRTIMNAHSRGLLMEIEYRRFETKFKVNAHTDNGDTITVHYGLIMPPWYFPGYKKWINELVIAPALVHEIGHNVVGNLEIISQNSSIAKEAFLKKKNCIINQFSQFKFKLLDENLNGTQYYDENLSDNLAYVFLDKIIESFNSSQAYLLPGLSYPFKQQLYMIATQEFCSTSNLKQEMHHKTVDPHAPLEFRIIGPAQNSKKFSEAFQCSEESYMNPKTKCSLLDAI